MENWILNANAIYRDSAFLINDDFLLSRDVDSRFLVIFRGGRENDNFGIYIAGNNLFDDSYVISQFPNLTGQTDPNIQPILQNAVPATPNFAQYGNPRTFSIQLEARF